MRNNGGRFCPNVRYGLLVCLLHVALFSLNFPPEKILVKRRTVFDFAAIICEDLEQLPALAIRLFSVFLAFILDKVGFIFFFTSI